MRYVLDVSVAIKSVLKEPDSPLAIALREDFKNEVHDLIAPDILPAEMGHALTRAERKGIIPKGDAKILFDEFINPCPQLYPFGDIFDRAMTISSDFRVGFYDALYVSLAEEAGCDLVTADEKLAKALPGFPIVSLADF